MAVLPNIALAAWLHAVGAICAIVAAAGLLGRQSAKQNKAVMRALVEQASHGDLGTAEALFEIAKLVSQQQLAITSHIEQDAPKGLLIEHDWAGLLAVLGKRTRALDAIGLHNLPAPLIAPASIIAGASIRFETSIRLAHAERESMSLRGYNDLKAVLIESKSLVDGVMQEVDSRLQALRHKGAS